jgi:hypothetical protein
MATLGQPAVTGEGGVTDSRFVAAVTERVAGSPARGTAGRVAGSRYAGRQSSGGTA